MDPNELVDMMRVSLLQRFGDIPEVHTFLALNEKKLKNQPLSLDEHIEFTRAQRLGIPTGAPVLIYRIKGKEDTSDETSVGPEAED